MKNGDARSAQWIKRKLKAFKRDNEATETCLLLVDIADIPMSVIENWTDAQCLLAEDWAMCVHLSASDNINRVPAVPAHLVPYRKAA